jgi:predicted P-loop ATPase
VATTNEDTYLRDTTGNRRFWPVKVGRIDLAGITRDRDQLWAEAAVAEASGEPLTITEELWSAAADQQRSRMNPDAWEEEIRRDLTTLMTSVRKRKTGTDGAIVLATNDNGDPEWRVSTNFLLRNALGISPERQGDAVTKRLAAVMRALGWTRPDNVIRIGKGPPCRGFIRVEVEPKKPSAAPLEGEVIAPPAGLRRLYRIRWN